MVLESFRRFGATKAAKLLLLALIVSFAAWGIEGFLQAQQSPHGVTVNGEGVSLIELEETYRQRLKQIETQLGQPLDAETRQNLGLGPQMVAEAAARTALRQTAAELHLQPATRTLQTEIASLTPFLDEQGRFDAQLYKQALANLGRTPAQFEAEMAQDLSVRNLSQLVQLAPVPTALAAQQISALNQRLEIEVATLKAPAVSETPSAAELEKFYALNPKTYEVPEHRSGLVLAITPEALSGTLIIPAAAIEAEYKANASAYTLPETRKVRHILVPNLASATTLQAQIKTQDDVIRLANQFSTDPGNLKTKGGDLGYIQKAEVVPAFANMAFALPTATLSAPVQSPFGWHLIWVDDIKPAQTQSLAEVKSKIEAQLREAELGEALTNLATQADERIAGGATLTEIAQKLGLRTELIARTTSTDEAVPPAYLSALFATAQGQVAPPVNLENGLAYVQTTRIEPASQPPLASLKATVVRDWQALQGELKAQRAADALLSAARAPASGGRTLAEAARQANVPVEIETYTIAENTLIPNWLRQRLDALSAMAVGQTLPQVLREENDWHLVRMASRAPLQTASPTAIQLEGLNNDLRGDMEALLVGYLQSGAKITCNAAGLKQVFGTDVPCPNGTR